MGPRERAGQARHEGLRGEAGAILVAAALLTSLGTCMFFQALDCTHRTHLVSAIAYTAPVFTLVAVKLLDRSTPIKPAHILAVLMTVCGVAIAVYTT